MVFQAKKKKQENPTRLDIAASPRDIIEVHKTAEHVADMKSPGETTFEATSKPSSTNVKSFMALKMKARLEKP